MSDSSRWKLDPDAVRRRAEGVPFCREVPCSGAAANAPAGGAAAATKSQIMRHQLSFLVGLVPGEASGKSVSRNVGNLARVTVFADTGTVGIARALHGEVRQVFRRNINTLDAVERILRQPPPLTVIDKTVVGLADDDMNSDQDGNSKTKDVRLMQTMILKTEIELADVGLAILQGEKERLENHLSSVKPLSAGTNHFQGRGVGGGGRPTSEGQNNQRSVAGTAGTGEDSFTSTSIQPGMEFQFSLPAQAMKHVDQCLNDINKMGKLVRGVATNGRGTVFLYGNGGVAYTPNIPRHLHQKLSQLRNSRMASRPSYVALGTRDRYFVTFHDGSFSCKGPKGLDRELRKLTKPPLSVSFGNSWDSFFIVFHDGSWKFQGRTIPDELEEKLAAREDRPDLICCHLGPSGEWFLKARNGRCWWGGIRYAFVC